ncbi:Hypothetical predicted protein [Mytilus galloprovincialis]|uniref:Uncharacterized protein n=1 Tax=Mytilus galloprovincialis TaxID=29158 RepID=A0A8B6EGQ1_MYTGA|nr:Hypothetical predicted protein [Mytilus galloprovincialis]
MRSEYRGKFILISNVQCIPCLESQNEKDKKEAEICAESYSECIRNSDLDKSNMCQLLKYMGYDFKAGDQVENLTKEVYHLNLSLMRTASVSGVHMHEPVIDDRIPKFLTMKLEEIDNDASSQYDSLAILFLSGETTCEAAKIYDKEGILIRRNEI